MDATHDPKLVSWVSSANAAGIDFPIQNLPFGIFARETSDPGRVGVAVGAMIVDVTAVHAEGLLDGDAEIAGRECARSRLNELMALGPRFRAALRLQLSGATAGRLDGVSHPRHRASASSSKHRDVAMRPPVQIGDYTDFYASVYHATNVGALFRPDNPLLPNYKWVPIGYHGRASSIIVSGTPVTSTVRIRRRRPTAACPELRSDTIARL